MSLANQRYEDISALWGTHLDGLIVTGTEPTAAALADEPCWPTLTKLVDWAEDHTVSTIWSCLAAHVAVLHTDGICRRALGEKLSGIFDCTKAENHRITIGAPSRWWVPHSRYNEVPRNALVSKGYQILSQSPDAGVDTFVKHRKSLFIFFQGHLRYDFGTLLLEYYRDSRRFLAGKRANYPETPRNYFDEEVKTALAEFRERAVQKPSIDLLSSFPAVAKRGLVQAWRAFAVQIYTNWLSYLAERRESTDRPAKSDVVHGGTRGLKSNAELTFPVDRSLGADHSLG